MTHRILVIDDDRDILKVLKAILELHSFEVSTAESWGSGREILGAREPDLLILDIMLPDGDGVDICRTIRKSNPRLPIVMLTAMDSLSDKVTGLESGADDYMVKPFETPELVARIKARLRRARPPRGDTLIVEDLCIDCDRRMVKIRGDVVDFTPKQYSLLCFLVANRGRVTTRDEIRRHLWKDSQIYSWSRVIDVHIQHLRQKIEENPSDPRYILTVPGVGYRFREQ